MTTTSATWRRFALALILGANVASAVLLLGLAFTAAGDSHPLLAAVSGGIGVLSVFAALMLGFALAQGAGR